MTAKLTRSQIIAAEQARLAELNKAKRDASVAKLGTKWALHPDNSPTRLTNLPQSFLRHASK